MTNIDPGFFICGHCGARGQSDHAPNCINRTPEVGHYEGGIYGTPRDKELAEDFYLVCKIFLCIAIASVAVGFFWELGKAIAGVLLG